MAELIRQCLQLVCRKAVVVPQDMVMRRPAGTLQRCEQSRGIQLTSHVPVEQWQTFTGLTARPQSECLDFTNRCPLT